MSFNKALSRTKNVIITGASKGLGKAIAEKFAAAGNHLFLCSRNEEVLQMQHNKNLKQKYNEQK